MSRRFITCHYTVCMSPGAEASILLVSRLVQPPDLEAPGPTGCGLHALLRPWEGSTPSLIALLAGPLLRGGEAS